MTASVLALAAVAVSLQVSVTNFINFAYGDFMTFGAYIAWTVAQHGVNFFAAVLIGGIATGILGVLANYCDLPAVHAPPCPSGHPPHRRGAAFPSSSRTG